MSKRRILVTAGLLIACSASLLHAQERQWLLDAATEDAFLIYGVPDTNDVALSFWCKLGSNKIHVLSAVRKTPDINETVNIVLAANGKEFLFEATLNAENQPVTVEAELVPQEDVLNALKAADTLSLTVLDHKNNYPLADADWDGLLTLCQKQPSVE